MFFRSILLVGLTIASLLFTGMSSSTQAPIHWCSTLPGRPTTCQDRWKHSAVRSEPNHSRSSRPDDKQPHLIGLRKTLLLVRPLHDPTRRSRSPFAMPKAIVWGRLIFNRLINYQGPAYSIDHAPNEPLDFTPARGTVATVKDASELKKLDDDKRPIYWAASNAMQWWISI